MDENKSELESLKIFIRECSVPFKDGIVFYTYLVLFIIGLGAFGIWGTLYLEINSCSFNNVNVLLSIVSFALPIYILLGDGIINISNDEFTSKFFRILMVVPPLLFLFTIFCPSIVWAYMFGILSVISTLFFWWIINANNPNLRKSSFLKNQKKKDSELNDAING